MILIGLNVGWLCEEGINGFGVYRIVNNKVYINVYILLYRDGICIYFLDLDFINDFIVYVFFVDFKLYIVNMG